MGAPFNAATMANLISMTMPGSRANKEIEKCEQKEGKRIDCCPYDENGSPMPEDKRKECFWCFNVKQCEVFPYKNKGDYCCNSNRGGGKKGKDGTREGKGMEGAHHLLPSAMGRETKGNSTKYVAEDAMTICVTGFSRTLQHGSCHVSLLLALQDQIGKYVKKKGSSIVSSGNRGSQSGPYHTTDRDGLVKLCIKSVTDVLLHCRIYESDIEGKMSDFYHEFNSKKGIMLHPGSYMSEEEYKEEETAEFEDTKRKCAVKLN